MNSLRLLLLAGLALVMGAAQAQVTEIWRCVDAQGNILFTSEKADTSGKQCSLVSRERVNPTPPAPAVRAPSPANFPRETTKARDAARKRQRQTLEQELKQEQDLLAKAQKALAEQEAVRYGNEHNYQRVLDRLKPYKEKVEQHKQNVEALKRELSNLDNQ